MNDVCSILHCSTNKYIVQCRLTKFIGLHGVRLLTQDCNIQGYVWHILFNHDYLQVKYQSLLLLYALGK